MYLVLLLVIQCKRLSFFIWDPCRYYIQLTNFHLNISRNRFCNWLNLSLLSLKRHYKLLLWYCLLLFLFLYCFFKLILNLSFCGFYSLFFYNDYLFLFFFLFFLFFLINCLYFSIIYILLMMSFCIIFYFLKIFCSHYFIRIKKLRFCIFFINQIETYISFFFFLFRLKVVWSL